MKVNGIAVASGTTSAAIPLAVGANTITVEVTAQNGTTKRTYTVTITRTASNVTTLRALALSAGPLNPAFAASTTAYTISVAHTVSKTTVTPTLTDAAASVKVNGIAVASGTASAAIPLAVGANTITVEVTAQNGTTKRTYTVTITRTASSNALLKKLAIVGGKLSPKFTSKTQTYRVKVAATRKSIQIQPTAAHSRAKILIAGKRVASGKISKPVALRKSGKTIIKIVVTAQNGTKKTYTITVTK
jgi:LEA14-like dessication related protein